MFFSPTIRGLAGRRALISFSAQRRMFVDTMPLLRSAQPTGVGDFGPQASITQEDVLAADDLVFKSEAESLHENSKWSVIQVRNLTNGQRDIKVTVINAPAYNWLQETLKPYRDDPIDLAANFKGYMTEIPKREKTIVIIPFLGDVFEQEYTSLKLPSDPAGNNSNDRMGYMIAREVGQDYSNQFLFAGVPVKGGYKYRIEGDSTQMFSFQFSEEEAPKMDRFDYPPLNA